MRCPKCSFISYDQVETCAKCGKNISAAAENLHGTTVNVPAPPFLQFEAAEPESQSVSEIEAVEEGAAAMGSGDEEFVDFSMEEEKTTDIEFDMGADETEEDGPIVDLSAEEGEDSIDLSDLAPAEDIPTEDAADMMETEPFEATDESNDEVVEDMADEMADEMAESVAEEMADEEDIPEPAAAEQGREGKGLKDLKVDIDLDETAAPKGKVMPSVKTGTALDDFDVDLGDLLTSKKK